MLGIILGSEVRAALFALASVGLGAWFYLKVPVFAFWTVSFGGPLNLVLFLLVLGSGLGLWASELGAKALPARPVRAMLFFETRSVVALTVLALITWATLCASGLLTAKDGDPAAVKQSFDALEKAVTAVIAALGAAIAGDRSKNAVAVLAQGQFEEAFKTYTSPYPAPYDHEVEHAVYGDPYVPDQPTNHDGSKSKGASGWDFEARWSRVRAILANR